MIKETTQLQGFPKMKLPKLKGEVEIRLHNPTTGKTEVHKGENMITNAVSDIFASNYGGQLNYSELLPLYKKMFGGIFCFKDAFSNESMQDATDYYVPDTSVTTVTAHAGQTGYTADYPQSDDITRGYPQETQMSIADGQVTLAWEWGVSNGNGVIKSLALTHADAGDMGTGSSSNLFRATRPMLDAKLYGDTSASASSVNMIMFIDSDGYGYYFTATAEHTITIKKMPFAYKDIGLVAPPPFTTQIDESLIITKTVTVSDTSYKSGSNIYQPYYCYDNTSNKLWLFYLKGSSSASNKINIDELDLSNFNSISVTHREFNPTNTTVTDLYNDQCPALLAYACGYVYIKTTVYGTAGYRPSSGLIRLKVSPYTAADETYFNQIVAPYGGSLSPTSAGKIVVGKYFIVNRNNLYPIDPALSTEVAGNYWYSLGGLPFICEQQGLVGLGFNRRNALLNPYVSISKFYLGSKYNLTGQGIEKRPSQNMLIKYTLKEVEPEPEEEVEE